MDEGDHQRNVARDLYGLLGLPLTFARSSGAMDVADGGIRSLRRADPQTEKWLRVFRFGGTGDRAGGSARNSMPSDVVSNASAY
jgi:hypothetical protein